MKKRLLSLLLVFVMVMGMIPTSVFAVENVPFTVTIDGTEMTEITEDVIQWPDWSGMPVDLPFYTVEVPFGATEADLVFDEDVNWTYYATNGDYIGNGDSSWDATTQHTIAIQDSNGDGEFDAVSVQAPDAWSPSYLILFVTAENSCLTVKDTAPSSATTKSGGLYQLKMADVFADTQDHELTYSYTYGGTIDYQFTNLKDGVLSLTAKAEGEYDLVLTATCEGGEVSHTVKLTVGPPNEGIEQQYSYDETDKSSVTVYVTVSSDGMPLETDYGVLANMEITVPYFELDLYGLQQYNRYETDGGKGPYINTNVVRRPTGLHLYIYLLERYYMGLPEEQCCNGTSGVLDYAKKHDVYYMGGEFAYNSGNNKALVYSGAATSIFMNQFWGHDCNLMYYRNHCYPYMSPGWGSTSDYILLSDGDAVDVAMFTNWGFYHSGYFASFDKDVYEVAEGGSSLTVKTRQWGTSAAAEDFVPVIGSEGMQVALYNSDWEEIATLNYDSDSSNTITFDVPAEDGVYFLMATDPNATDVNEAKIAPAVARIVVGDQSTGGDVSSYYADYEFISIKDDQDRYLVDITPGTVDASSNSQSENVPTHQVVIEEGTEKVYVTFPAGNDFAEYIAIYDVENRTTDYGWGGVAVVTNDDGTVTVEIPVADYLETGYGVILEEDGSYTWLYGFDFVTGTITKVTAGTAVSRILLNSYTEHLWIGDSVTLTPTVLPAEATDWTILWTSSNEAAATVDQNGKITAVGNGTAIITAAIGDVTVSCTVTAEKYNTAPTVVSGAPSWAKIKVNTGFTVDAAPMFTDAQNDALIYTAQVYKASGLSGAWEYNYTLAEDMTASVNNGKITVSIPKVGVYALKITASDGKLSVTHTYQLTVVKNDAGVINLNDGVTFNLYNVAAVGYSTEFVEDYNIPNKGTHDTTIHKIVLSKDTVSGTPSRKFAITLASGYQWGQYSAAGTATSFSTRADIGVFAYDPNTKQSTAHYLKFYTECSGEHTDADGNEVCDKCTLKIEKPGKFAFLAINENGYLIEPCYISYAAGATVKEALKNSGHTFEGIDSGFISAIDGKTDNYSLHYDGDGYSLDTAASRVTTLWFTTNSSQTYSEDLLNLVSQMAKYNTSTNGVKDYPAAQQAYAAAAKDFYQTSNAAKLYTDLKTAMDKFDTFLQGDKVPVGLQITMGDSSVSVGKAVFTSEYGTTVETENLIGVDLVPGTYTFDISDGSFRHTRGTIEVKESMVLTAELPTGKWINSLELSMTSGDKWKALPKKNSTDAGATFYVPDYADYSLYPYIERNTEITESDTSHQVFNGDSAYARAWASKSTALVGVIEDENLDDLTLVLECRQTAEDANGYELYQTYTIDIQRVPTLENLAISGDGTAMKLEFEKDTLGYFVTTTATTVDVTPTALSEGVTVTVAGKQAVSGQSINITLADCDILDGDYLVPVVVTAPNGQSRQYMIEVTKVDPVQINLIAPDKVMTVTLVNEAGAVIDPYVVQGPGHIYRVVPNQEYTYTITANGCYHATAKVTPVDRTTVVRATEPKTEDWLAGLAAKAANNNTAAVYDLTPGFDPATHTYSTQVESNSNAFWLQAYATDTSKYTTEAIYTSHNNSAYSEFSTQGRKEYVKTPGATSSKYVNMTNFLGGGGWNNEMLVRVTQKATEDGVTYYQDYTITVNRTMTLNALSAKDNNGITLPIAQKDTPDTVEFAKLVYNYTAKIGATATEMSVVFKANNSTNAYDSELYTVTVACGAWSKDITYATKAELQAEQTVVVPLSGTIDTDTVTIAVKHTATGAVAQTYSIELTKLPPVATTFVVNPADATVFLTDDTTGGRISPEADGTYILNTDASYTYVISRNGYVAQTASFVAGEANKTVTVSLEKAPESTLKDISQDDDWLQFRTDENNNGVVDVKTPIKAEDAVLEWANQIGEGFGSGATGCPIIVGGYLYTYAGNSIVKVSTQTGEVVGSGMMAGSSSFAINSPTYANGMIFVALSNGRVQAFNAETLQSLWVFQDTLGGQPNCPIAYCDGYVYTGFWNSETQQANFVCLSVTDEDPSQTEEAKLATWIYTHNGFYWAGAYACEDFVLIGTDDGDSGYTAGYASILSLNPKTGVLLDEEKLTNVGDQRSSICYDAATDAYYFTTKGGDFYQIKVNADGTFQENSLRRLHLDNGTYNAQTPPMSTSTPVIYNGRAYIGVSGTGQFSAYSGHNMTVIDLETFSIAYTVPTMGYPQTSGLLTTAYEDVDGYVYVYFIDNYTPGMIRVIRDKKGMDEVDHTYTSMMTYTVNGEEKTIETGYILFTPHGDEAQYAICSPITDSDGNLYFKNDSARMMRLSSRMTSLEITQQPEKQTYCVGKTFDGTGMKVIAHYANGTSKDITQYVSFTTEPLTMDDTEITISYDPDKLFEDENTAAGGYWQWYQDVDGAAGQTYYLPTATVNITINSEHSFTDYKSNSDATCETDGTKTAQCDHCDAVDIQPDVGSKKDHSFTDYKSDNNAACEADGTKTAVCDRNGCEETDTQPDVGSKKSHSFTDYKSNNDATCEADGTKTAVCNHDGCEETDTQPDVGSKKSHSFTDYKSNNDATCEADGTKTAVCDRDGCEKTDTQVDVGSKKVEPETKLEITEGGITVIPDALKEADLDTPEKVKETIAKAIITQNSKIDEKSVVHYDVTLMYSEDGGKTWIKADETHWPASGKLKVTLPYPSGTDKTYSFTVVHMFTSTAFGKTPGDVEMPTVTNTDKGIEFEVTGLSPISVGWTAPKETPSTPSTPATGDTTPVVLLTCVMLLSVTMLAVLLIASKKRRA